MTLATKTIQLVFTNDLINKSYLEIVGFLSENAPLHKESVNEETDDIVFTFSDKSKLILDVNGVFRCE